MRRLLFLLLATAAAVFCADDPWTAVTKLQSGQEIRVFKKGSTQPVIGKFDEATDERLLLVVKNGQIAIAKDQVDRLEARPQPGSRVKVTGTTTTDDPQAAKEPKVGMNGGPVTGETTSSNVAITGRPDFELVYRRQTGGPKKADTAK